MKVALTGASGFVGRALTNELKRQGHSVQPVSLRGPLAPDALAGCDAVVNLAGEPVAQRWTAEARAKIRTSRVEGTRKLVDAMRAHRPQVLVSGSAVGYYGSRGDTLLTEAEPAAQDFLGEVALAWEQEAAKAEELGVRGARIRIGMVLGKNGGALQKMLLPFKLGLGGPIAGGAQWMSWIHIVDLVDLILFLLRESTVRGVFNAVSPNPVTNADFTTALGKALRRPTILPVPEFAIKALFGEMSEVILASQRAIPDAAIRQGFTFRYPDIYGALLQIIG
ncbi:MAG: TIGR01777 family oxidoreductase [Acidobacteriota bacterium]